MSKADPGQSLVTYTAEPASPTQDALDLLASWAATNAEVTQPKVEAPDPGVASQAPAPD